MDKNWSIYTADRTTHLKIVVVALVGATLIAGFGIAARNLNPGTDLLAARGPAVYQPANTTVFTQSGGATVR